MGQRLLRPLLFLGAIALFAVGCSGASVGLVKGKVFYNNEPLSGAELEFKPEKDLALGAFSAVDQKAILVDHDDVRRQPTVDGWRRGRRAEKQKLKHAFSGIPVRA